MPYTPTNWVDNTTPLSAANLNNLETQYSDAVNDLTAKIMSTNANLLFNSSANLGFSGWNGGIAPANWGYDAFDGVADASYFAYNGTLATDVNSAPITIGVGVPVTISGYVFNGSTNGANGLVLTAFNSSGTNLGNFASVTIPASQGWTYVSVTGTTPAGTATVSAQLYVPYPLTTAGSGAIAWTRIKVENGSVATPYSMEGDLNYAQYGALVLEALMQSNFTALGQATFKNAANDTANLPTQAVSPDGSIVGLAPSLGAGSFSGLVQAGDQGLIWNSKGSPTNASWLSIVPWFGSPAGIRLGSDGSVKSAKSVFDDGTGAQNIAGPAIFNGVITNSLTGSSFIATGDHSSYVLGGGDASQSMLSTDYGGLDAVIVTNTTAIGNPDTIGTGDTTYSQWRLRLQSQQDNVLITRAAPSSTVETNMVSIDNAGDVAFNGAISSNTPLNSFAGLTAGTVYWVQDMRGTVKRVIIVLVGYECDSGSNSQSITFPVAFSQTPGLFTGQGQPSLPYYPSTTGLGLPYGNTTVYNGVYIIEGY